MLSGAKLICRATGESYDTDDPRWRSDSGGVLSLDFSPVIDTGLFAGRPFTPWRYREAIPLPASAAPVSLGESVSPLVRVDVGGRSILIKQDHINPTGSYKDRGAAVMVSKIHQLGIRHVVEDSSGNAGCSVAAYCARSGIQCDIFVPETTSTSKLLQLEYFGAHVHRISGTREDTARAARSAAESSYYASHVWNPFFFHGTKLFAYEVAEQLGWHAPDVVILPVGNGTLLLGAFLGFNELLQGGAIASMPRIVGVQAAACSPLAGMFRGGSQEFVPVRVGQTIAEGIAIANPVRWEEILAAVRDTQGEIFSVSDESIRSALLDMGRKGFYIEPTAAAAIAGVSQYVGRAGAEETVVSVFSGSGLKASHAMDMILHPGG